MTNQPTNGSLFHGDVTARDHSLIVGGNLTVQGISDADLDTLAARILDALRADAAVTIAGGPENTTVLALDGEPHVVVSREQGRALARRTTGNVEDYLTGLVVHRDFGPWDTRYVPLAGVAARPATPDAWAGYIPVELCALCRQGEGPEQRIERVPIDDIADAVRDYPQFVLLGEPGAGKTTVLQKVALDAARARLRDDSAPVPLFVRLGAHRGTEPPAAFLAGQWRSRVGTDFEQALRSGSALLLLDALNEMPRAGYAERVAAWRAFAQEWDGVRMLFTCRTLDYALPLPLQQVQVNRLDDGRVRDFLRRYIPDRAEQLWEALSVHQRGLLDLARNPFLLAVLAWTYAGGALPPNRGQLLAGLVTRLLDREQQRAHPGWIDAEAQQQALAALAWTLQEQGEGTSLPTGNALQAIPSRVTARGRKIETPPETVLQLACAATLLEETLEGQTRFYHHLVQEYFAARELLRRFEAGDDLHPLWKAPWLARDMPDPEDQGEWDPLPPPPTTGWEETTITAAGVAADPAALVRAVWTVNPILTGRCLDESGAHVPDDLREQMRSDLLSNMQDRRVHLRARIAAGHVLGRLGDPRFEVRERDGIRYILPPLVRVPGGAYTIGSPRWDRQAYGDERPRHKVALAEFHIGQYPVTVAEYRCFVEAGGYRDGRYWKTEAARAWLRGEEVEGGAMEGLLENRRILLESNRPLEDWAKEYGWTPQTLETWQALTAMSEEQAREALRPIYATRSRREPYLWNDAAYTGPNQPVIGVTWYEANAYCAWLAEVLGCPCRLPTEAEWEAAVRGRGARLYPWGNRFDVSRANTVEGRVLGTTPVGVYPDGVGQSKVWDGAGNVWEWTSTLYRPYPYQADDGREDPSASGRRVMRGGSWGSAGRAARCGFRGNDFPDGFYSLDFGFRVVHPGSLPQGS
jgi:formylglycine-generating enzyme required for sulfatase activity